MSIRSQQTSSLTNVPSANTNTNLLAANAAASARMIYNDSTAVLYVKFGTTASASSYTVQLAAGAYYEFPQPLYGGNVDGIWASANGNARVTEVSH